MKLQRNFNLIIKKGKVLIECFVGPDNWNDYGIRDRWLKVFAKHFCLAGTRIEINQHPRYKIIKPSTDRQSSRPEC